MGDVSIACEAYRTIVGESPVWDDRTGVLYWVDIVGKSILALDPMTGKANAWETEDFPTAIGLCKTDGKAVVAFAGGVSTWEIGTDRLAPFATIDDDPDGNRLNEGAIGPDGAFWIGTMQTNLNPDGSMREMDRSSGALYRIAPDGTVRRMTEHIFGISNTLVWDEARGQMIFGDTLRQTLFRMIWPVGEGMQALEEWAVTTGHGSPDGSCIDDDGCVWNARYAGGRVIRHNPDGSVIGQLELPATNITACAFGGEDRRTLYVTTATNQLSEAALANPHEGALLAADVGVAGPKTYRFEI
ncbi:MAG: SMP-30/gluconolactonase/LRE family protein [Rhodospirillaceae bacterium]|nr:SMP-30/gluconolactonase/LRE family protein [Rhodospirillaceae bacterium]